MVVSNEHLNERLTLSKFFPHNTNLANHFVIMLSTLFPFKDDEIVRFYDILDLDLLIENPNISWTRELIVKCKDDILYTDFFRKNKSFIWDLAFLQNLNIDSRSNLDLEESLINFSWEDYLILIKDYPNIKFKKSIVNFTVTDIRRSIDLCNSDWKVFSTSECFKYEIDVLKEFEEFWDWDLLSQNENVLWDFRMIDCFESKINWNFFAKNKSIQWTKYLVHKYSWRIKWDMKFVNNCLQFIDEDEFLRLFRFEIKNLIEKDNDVYLSGKRCEKVICEFNDLYNVFRKLELNSNLNKMFHYLPQSNYEKSENNLYKIFYYRGGELILSLQGFEKFLLDYPEITVAQLSRLDTIYWDDDILFKYKDEWDWVSFMKSNSYYDIESILEDYCGIINWEILCSKAIIEWDEEIIDKYLNYVRFDVLSRNPFVKWSTELFFKYMDRWILNEDNCYIGYYSYNCRVDNNSLNTDFFNGFLLKYFDREEFIHWLEDYSEDRLIYFLTDHNKIIEELKAKIDYLESIPFQDRNERMYIYSASSKISPHSNKEEAVIDAIERDYKFVLKMIERVNDFCLCSDVFRAIKNANFSTYDSMSTERLNYIESLRKINNLKYEIFALQEEVDRAYFDEQERDWDNETLNSAFDGDEDAYWNWRNE
ncbi:MAG: hypothetical protein PHE56_03115 [Bacteroidales bacterium]|nr:hypothetical protein [Bacteroidales bacterium]